MKPRSQEAIRLALKNGYKSEEDYVQAAQRNIDGKIARSGSSHLSVEQVLDIWDEQHREEELEGASV